MRGGREGGGMARGDELRKRLAAGDNLLAAWLTLCSNISAEIMGLAGFDVLIIDQEHGPGDLQNAVSLMQAVKAGGSAVCLMRLASGDLNLIKRALDTGVDGLMIPMIETAEQAKAVVAACRLPPAGIRGIAPGSVRAARYGLDRAGFIAAGGRDLFIICQVETKATLDRIPAIASVEGVDMLFVGRNDLASSIHRAGEMDHPEAKALLADAEARIKATGKPLGGITAPGDDARALFARGHRLVIAGSDHTLLRDAALATVRGARA